MSNTNLIENQLLIKKFDTLIKQETDNLFEKDHGILGENMELMDIKYDIFQKDKNDTIFIYKLKNLFLYLENMSNNKKISKVMERKINFQVDKFSKKIREFEKKMKKK
jgi:hypothetical protein